jgi:DNA-binding Xre family transcriptional regulator
LRFIWLVSSSLASARFASGGGEYNTCVTREISLRPFSAISTPGTPKKSAVSFLWGWNMKFTKEETERFRALRKTIGENILQQRRKRKLSLYRLSKDVGITPHNLDLFELGKKHMNIEKLVKIASVLGVDPKNLLG